MKRTLPILALLAGQALALQDVVPQAFPADRYEMMVKKSPFALATPVVPQVTVGPNFAASWYLTAVGRDAQGQDFITVKAQDGSVHFSLAGNEPNSDATSPAVGVSLASLNWSDTFRKSTAIIKKGTETAKLEFSKEDAIAVVPPAAVKPGALGPGRPMVPGAPQLPVTVRPVVGGIGNLGGGAPLPPTAIQPRIALPRPSTAPVVTQPPPVVAQPGAPTGLPVGEPTGENRRRIRNIAAPQ